MYLTTCMNIPYAFRFRLCEGSEQRQHDLAVAGEAVDVFFFKPDADA